MRDALTPRLTQPVAAPSAQRGLSLVELMIALALGLIVLAALVSVFANSSASRQEMERTSRQIENGRYAMQLLSDDLRLAGFYGEANVRAIPAPGVMPDVCSISPTDWAAAMPLHLMGWDNGVGRPACTGAAVKANTDVVTIRRVSTCEAGVVDCPIEKPNKAYIQVSKCATQTPITPFQIGIQGSTTFDRTAKDCGTPAGKRRYIVNTYFISPDNGRGEAIPTLKRIEFDGELFTEVALVEGIEELHLEYGIDTNLDGSADVMVADPSTYACAGPPACTPISNWANVVSVRINLLARNLEASVDYTDTKRYTLGRDASGAEIVVAPGGPYRRHAYTGLVRVINAAERRDSPTWP